MQYHGFLMKRYIFRRVIPYAAVLAVAFGVFALISVLAVMEGFKEEMRGRIRGSLSHLTIFSHYSNTFVGADDCIALVEGLEHVEAAAPYIEAQGLYRANTITPCQLRGIDPLAEARVGDFRSYLLTPAEIDHLLSSEAASLPEDRTPSTDAEITRLFSLERRKELHWRNLLTEDEGFALEAPPQPVIVGIEALRQGLRIGNIIDISSYSPADFGFRSEEFIVVGAFQTGVFEQDQHWIYTPIQVAVSFLDLFDEDLLDDRITGISIRLDDYRNASKVAEAIEIEVVPSLMNRDVIVKSWEEQRRNLLRAVEVEKRIISVMMMLIVLFAGVMIFLILTLMVIEKTRDLGVLRSLGATRRGVITLFLRQGMALTVLGVIVGSLAGIILIENINPLHDAVYRLTGLRLFPPDIYYLDRIPTRMRATDWATVLVPAFVFGYLGSLLPALWAARRDPVKALHHE